MRDKNISFHKSKSGIPLEKAAEAAFPLIIFNAEFVFDHGCDIINDSFELVDFFPFAHDADQRSVPDARTRMRPSLPSSSSPALMESLISSLSCQPFLLYTLTFFKICG